MIEKIKANLIYNPNSGQIWSAFKPSFVKEFLNKKGWEVDISETQYKDHAIKLASDSVGKYDVVIAAGGDGTINEAVQGIAGTNVKLAILPVGTTNVLARDLNIPLNFQEALAIIPSGEAVEIDLGVINDRYFILMVGIGFDAKLVNEVDSKFKKLTGVIAFAATSPVSMLRHRIGKMSITFWDSLGKKKKIQRNSYQVLVSNASTYATSLKVATEAKVDDGVLDVDIFKSNKIYNFAWNLISIAVKKYKHNHDVSESFKISKMNIKTFPPMPIQVDGDSFGYTPASIEIKPKFLKIIKPINL